MPSVIEQPFKIDKWTVYPDRHLLIDEQAQIERNVAPNLMTLLLYLSDSQGKVISREQLINDVWHGSIISDESVSRSIGMLRKLLDDPARSPRYIKTISKQGYQFLVKPTPALFVANDDIDDNKADVRYINHVGFYAIVILVFIIVYLAWPKTMPPPKATQFSQMYKMRLSSQQKLNRQPRFSPDGRFVASIGFAQGEHSLELRDLTDGSDRVLFSSTKEFYKVPSFSPTGEELAFVRIEKNKKNPDCQLLIYTFKTNQIRQVRGCRTFLSANLSWTKDGKKLIATELDKDNVTVGLVEIDIQSGTAKHLTFPDKGNSGYLFPRLSPDNERIAFVLFDNQTRSAKIGLYQRSDKTVTTLVPRFEQVQQVVWGKNDTEIYFSDINSTAAGIWHLDLTTQKTTFVYNELIRDFDVDLNTGNFVANINRRDLNIWQTQFAADGQQVEKSRLLDSSSDEFYPSLSHDGLRLAYADNRGGFDNVWVKDLTSGKTKQLTQFNSGKIKPAKWAKDDSKLTFIHTLEQNSTLYVIDAIKPGKVLDKIEQATFTDWHDSSMKLTVLYDQLKRPGVYLYDLADKSQNLLFEQAIYTIATVKANHYIVQKSRNRELHQVQLVAGKANWQTFPGIEIALDWQLRGNNVTLLYTTEDLLSAIKVLQVPTFKERRDLNALFQPMQQKSFNLDSQQRRFFYVRNDDLRMDLFLIKPLTAQQL